MGKISVSDLEPGMVLNEKVESSSSGAVFISEGTVLNRRLILRIKNLGIKYVDILEKEYIDKDENKDNLKAKHEVLSNKVKKVFINVKFGKKIIMTEISDEIDGLISELVKNDNILGRLKQLEKNDDYIFSHSMNVCMFATMLGKWLNYSKVELKQLSISALFHDIGKLRIAEDIINKSGELTEKEFKIANKHPIYGYKILEETIGISKNIGLGVLHHHERENGTGYPFKLNSNEIHEFGKIIAVCDIYDSLTSDRPYREKISPFLVAEYLEDKSFDDLNPRITRVFLDSLTNFYVGRTVKLDNDKVGKVIYIHPNMPNRPIVKVENEYIDFLKEKKLKIVDIIK